MHFIVVIQDFLDEEYFVLLPTDFAWLLLKKFLFYGTSSERKGYIQFSLPLNTLTILSPAAFESTLTNLSYEAWTVDKVILPDVSTKRPTKSIVLFVDNLSNSQSVNQSEANVLLPPSRLTSRTMVRSTPSGLKVSLKNPMGLDEECYCWLFISCHYCIYSCCKKSLTVDLSVAFLEPTNKMGELDNSVGKDSTLYHSFCYPIHQ